MDSTRRLSRPFWIKRQRCVVYLWSWTCSLTPVKLVTRISQSGFIIFVGRDPIIWHSRKQNTIELSAYCSEFVALKDSTESNRALRYKFRILGIDVDGKTNVFSDNNSVILNSSLPKSIIKNNITPLHITHYNGMILLGVCVCILNKASPTWRICWPRTWIRPSTLFSAVAYCGRAGCWW